jgi:hypothetical protein
MSPLGRLSSLASDDRGAVLVIFALFAPVAILFASFAIDTGNWFLHKRHLQGQADAAVFAAAREFQPCVDENIYYRGGQYGGDATVATPSGTKTFTFPKPGEPYNQQEGRGTPESGIHVLINSKRYYGQSSPVDETAVEEPPCKASMVDAKITESNLPWYWRVFSTVPHINAHARIEILQEKNPKGIEPLAITESAPLAAEAYFVNEDNKNAVIAKTALKDLGSNGKGQDVWANSEAPLAVPLTKTNFTTARIGVVIALSGKATDTSCPSHQYVNCFDETTGPLMHIAGYSESGTGTLTTPLARQVTLSNPTPNTCTDGYFSDAAGSCTFTLTAKVDYGSAVTKGMSVTPEVGATKGAALTFNVGTGLWSGSATLPAGSGSNELKLIIKCENKVAGSPCEALKAATTATVKEEREKGKLVNAVVHRIYAASAGGSGTITGAWISEVGGLAQDANSFKACEGCTHKLVVTVDVGGSLEDARNFKDPLFHMRFGNPTAEVVGCEPGKEASGAEYREHLASGCEHSYKRNTTDPNCTSTGEPFDCFGKASGVKTGPFEQGLEERFVTAPPAGKKFYCPNNWVEPKGGGLPLIPADDSRVITLFIEPYAASAASSTPIQDFATFYVTGWNKSDPCNAKAAPSHPDDVAEKGEIVGHFIKYVNTVGKGEGGEEKCSPDPAQLGPCVAVLTR